MAQLPNYPTYTHGVTPVSHGMAVGIDTDDNGTHDRVIVSGVTDLPFINPENVPVELTVYDIDESNGQFVPNNAIDNVDPVVRGFITTANFDDLHGNDVLLSGATLNSLTNPLPVTMLYLDDGSGGYQTGIPLVGLFYSTGNFFDFDNDGDMDIFISGIEDFYNNDKRFIIYENVNGTPVNIFDTTNSDGVEYGSSNVVDVNNDGYDDIILTGATDGGVFKGFTVINNGNGTFTFNENLSPAYETTSASGDLNNDGNQDVIITGQTVTDQVTDIWLGDGTGGFTLSNSTLTTKYKWANSLLHDFDDDGDLDYFITGREVASGASGKARVYLNDGTAQFTECTTFTPQGLVYPISLILNIKMGTDVKEVLFLSGNTDSYPTNDIQAYAYIIGDAQLSVDQYDISHEVTMYPNPASSKVKFTIPLSESLDTVVITDMFGKTVYTATGLYINEVDVSTFSSGMYYVQITTKSGAIAGKKLIKK